MANPCTSTKSYRQQVLNDRRKTLQLFGITTPNVKRNEEITNKDPLPKAQENTQAKALQLYAEYNSWQMCTQCFAMLPRELTPESMTRLLSPWCKPRECIFCRKSKPAPEPSQPMQTLRHLPRTILQALEIVKADYGPIIQAKDALQRPNGYRFHAALVSFQWHPETVKDRLNKLEPAQRQWGFDALQYLLQISGPEKAQSAYGTFYQEQTTFLQNNPNPEPRRLKRWLRFIEREGLECALWPHLFTQRQHCLTWARLQSTSRQARQTSTTAANSTNHQAQDRQDIFAMDYDKPSDSQATGTKRSFMKLILHPLIDYSISYELLHFAFDLNLWTDLGSKQAMNLGVPMRLLLKNQSFSSEFWRDMHRAVIDMVRQKGYPKIFSTHSPYEWSWPNHRWIIDTMTKARLGNLAASNSFSFHSIFNTLGYRNTLCF